MAKNILEPDVKQHILSRIDSLTPTSERKWGKMNVNQSLRHMTFGFQMPLGEKLEPKNGGKVKQTIMKWMLLNMPVPKGRAETFPSFNTVKLGILPTDFEAERNQLKYYIERFSSTPTFIDENPMGGKFTRDDWGKLMYNHTDHHLKQFGA